ncbi:MAG TPA: hypothetical protein VFJ23_02660, partial [Candidatus Nitrosotalea sp.]|nr:hypothetical protein [Candidatus Nitrosotalea sp.]
MGMSHLRCSFPSLIVVKIPIPLITPATAIAAVHAIDSNGPCGSSAVVNANACGAMVKTTIRDNMPSNAVVDLVLSSNFFITI